MDELLYDIYLTCAEAWNQGDHYAMVDGRLFITTSAGRKYEITATETAESNQEEGTS